VEQGTHIASRKLIAAREILRKTHHIVAPCTHQNACGLLTPDNASHWCHHFAKPPGEVFRSAFWQEFTKELNIDLHSLPVSYLVGQKKPAASSEANLARVIGYARLYKGYCKFLACAHDGVREKRLQK